MVCAPCLDAWFRKRNESLRAENKPEQSRRHCPFCQTELSLRGAGGEAREQTEFTMGLLRVKGTWD